MACERWRMTNVESAMRAEDECILDGGGRKGGGER